MNFCNFSISDIHSISVETLNSVNSQTPRESHPVFTPCLYCRTFNQGTSHTPASHRSAVLQSLEDQNVAGNFGILSIARVRRPSSPELPVSLLASANFVRSPNSHSPFQSLFKITESDPLTVVVRSPVRLRGEGFQRISPGEIFRAGASNEAKRKSETFYFPKPTYNSLTCSLFF